MPNPYRVSERSPRPPSLLERGTRLLNRDDARLGVGALALSLIASVCYAVGRLATTLGLWRATPEHEAWFVTAFLGFAVLFVGFGVFVAAFMVIHGVGGAFSELILRWANLRRDRE